MQVISHTASDEPEASHPAAKVSDNDIDPESRWAAENDAWIILDMGREERQLTRSEFRRGRGVREAIPLR